jgi:hypothetical protein
LSRNLIELAEAIAVEAHRGQTDKVGVDYITHPRRVALNAETVPHDTTVSVEDIIVCAWLHDVIEDGPANGYTRNLEEWLAQGIEKKHIDAIKLVSYEPPQLPREMQRIERDALTTQCKIDYYNTLKVNPLARAVKLADLADNCNIQRGKALKASGAHYDRSKYPLAVATIGLTEEEWAWFREAIKIEVD